MTIRVVYTVRTDPTSIPGPNNADRLPHGHDFSELGSVSSEKLRAVVEGGISDTAGGQPTADTAALVHNDDIAGTAKAVCRGQPRQAGTDDHNPPGIHRAPPPRMR